MNTARKRTDAWITIGICIFAFSLRLAFISLRPLPPLKWDAAGYWMKGRELAQPINSWSELKKNLNHLATRGPVYPVFLSFFFRLPLPALPAARVWQGVLDALVCGMLYILGIHFKSRPGGAVAAILSAVYLPFIFSASAIMQECLTGFLATLIVLLLVKAAEKESFSLLFFSGVLTTLLILGRRLMLYLPCFLLVTIGIVTWSQRRRLLRPGSFLLGFLLVLVAWLTLIAAVPPRFPLDIIFGYSNYPWILHYLETDGWAPDILDYRELKPPDRDLERDTEKSYTFRERVAHLLRAGRSYPGWFAQTFYKNLYRQWSYPYFACWPPLILSDPQLTWFHRLIVLLSLIGIPLSFRAGKKAWLPVAVLGYSSLLVPIVIVEPRMTLPVMPLVILMAGIALSALAAGLGSCLRSSRGTGFWPALVTLGVSLVLLVVLSLPVILERFPSLSLLQARAIRFVLINLLIIALARTTHVLLKRSCGGRAAGWASGFTLLVLGGTINFIAATDYRWTSWSSRLTHPRQEIRQEFVLPEGTNLDECVGASLFIDMQKGPGADVPVKVAANGRELPVSFQPPADAPLYGLYVTGANWRGLILENIRQWVTVPIDLGLLADGRLAISIKVDQPPGKEKGHLDVWGDYLTSTRPNSFSGPALPKSSGREHIVSAYKWITDWDKRIDRETELGGGEVSALFLRVSGPTPDLSPSFGLQTGEFRIRLMLKKLPEIIRSNLSFAGGINLMAGVKEIVSAPETKKGYPDFLSQPETGWAYLVRPSSPSPLVWKSAPCPTRKRTVFEFVGNASRAPGELELSVNGAPAVSFQTGTDRTMVCKNGGYELLFELKERITEGKKNRDGSSGVYFLSVPAEAVIEGKSLELSARFVSGSPEAWFLIKDYPPPTIIEYIYF